MSSRRVLGNRTLASQPHTLIRIFSDQAAAHPDALAIDTGHDSITYSRLSHRYHAIAEELSTVAGRGDHVGIAITDPIDYYASILATLSIGAAYVPTLGHALTTVSTDLRLTATITDVGIHSRRSTTRRARTPSPSDTAAVFFGPRSMVLPHRCASAGITAEACLFAPDNPIGPGDHVGALAPRMSPRSVEDMWLAWSTGACLVPYPADPSVRIGPDQPSHTSTPPTNVDQWITDHGISVISTTPREALSWRSDPTTLRLLIVGGEPCPADITRVMTGREVWNTYRTEATGVTTAAQLMPDSPPSLIGQPLPGWEATVIDEVGHPVEPGRAGELVISGVGLAHYFDLIHDAETFAPVPQFGWERAYRTGDLVAVHSDGPHFVRHLDEQARIAGHRVDLNHVDAVLHDLPGADNTTAALTRSPHGPRLLGYVQSTSLTEKSARTYLSQRVPQALVPSIHVVETLPHGSAPGTAPHPQTPHPDMVNETPHAPMVTSMEPSTPHHTTTFPPVAPHTSASQQEKNGSRIWRTFTEMMKRWFARR